MHDECYDYGPVTLTFYDAIIRTSTKVTQAGTPTEILPVDRGNLPGSLHRKAVL